MHNVMITSRITNVNMVKCTETETVFLHSFLPPPVFLSPAPHYGSHQLQEALDDVPAAERRSAERMVHPVVAVAL